MSNLIANFGKSVLRRWKTEYRSFIVSRNELLYVQEFRIALFLTVTPVIFIPILWMWPPSGDFVSLIVSLIALAALLSVYFWLMGLWFITVGGVLFDSIPTVSDVSTVVDAMDGLWAEKIRRISVALKKKESFENGISNFLRGVLKFFTVILFRKAKKISDNSLAKIRGLAIFDWVFELMFALFVFIIPVSLIACIGILGLLVYLRPSIARLPLLLVVLAYFIVIILIIGNTSLMDSPATTLIVPFFLGGYTFFFAEKNDLLMVKEIFHSITERV